MEHRTPVDGAASIVLGDSKATVYPSGLAVSPDGKTLYRSYWNACAVTATDTASLNVKARISVGDHSSGLALSPDNAALYTANANSDSVSMIDTATNAVQGKVNLSP